MPLFTQMTRMVLLCMKNTENNDELSIEIEEYFVGKPFHEQLAKLTIVFGPQVSKLRQVMDASKYLCYEIIAKPRHSFLVPFLG